MGHSLFLVYVNFFFFTFLNWEKQAFGIGKKGGYFRLGMGPKFSPLRTAENRVDKN